MMSIAETERAAGSPFAAAAEALRTQRLPRNPRLREAEKALRNNRFPDAHEILSRFLERHPRDVIALHLMAETSLRQEHKEEGEALLERCLALAPDFAAARYNYATVLALLDKQEAALAQIELLLKRDASNPLYRDLRATVLTALGRHAESLLCRAALAEDFPLSAEAWVNYGSALRSVGRTQDSIAAYREAIALSPSSGDAYWRLSGLKDYRFTSAEIRQMQEQLARAEASRKDRMDLHFALGKALGDEAQYEKSFENYARANALERLGIAYDADSLTKHVKDCKALFTEHFFRSRAGMGCKTAGPVFIVGMQRAGSTLLEQILVSHSAVEATAELPIVSLLAQHIGETIAPRYALHYPAVLARLEAATLAALGERYMERAQPHRRLGRPFFVDKMPYNFLHAGLIHLILPNARIIDARRHPLGCCFSNFAMHFKSGPLFASRLTELGRTYADYVQLMAHFDSVSPGCIHRVLYEDLVHAPEREIRRLLDYVGLPFEETCLEFHKSDRAMDSASSEQVRRPIYDDALNQWRHYEPWLGPLKAALGSVLEIYPDVPEFAD